jgi:predicted nucleotidyltransferase
MPGIAFSVKTKKIIDNFLNGLKDVYADTLVSVILYGSAVSGEFVESHSNINLLVVLKDTGLDTLSRASKLVSRFSTINPLFLTQGHIDSSTDIFPIEFLDMRDNHLVLYGKDLLADVNIDTRNLKFACEQELKIKLISLKHLYLKIGKNSTGLRSLLFKSFTSVLHVLRSALRLKAKTPSGRSQDVLKELSAEFHIDAEVWEKILAAKSKKIKLSKKDVEGLFVSFVGDLEKIVEAVDKL